MSAPADLLYRYAAAVDDGDLDALAAMVTDDVAITRVDGTSHGRDAFLAVYRAFRDSPVRGSTHAVTNVRVTPQPDGQLRADAYFQATMFDADGVRLVVGRYSDSMRDDGDGLRFTHKRIVVEGLVSLPDGGADWATLAPKVSTP